MAEILAKTQQSIDISIRFRYILFLPKCIRIYENLDSTFPSSSMSYNPSGSYTQIPYLESGVMFIPLDLITAARLGMIKPDDDSGLTDAQWAWIKLIGLTGELT